MKKIFILIFLLFSFTLVLYSNPIMTAYFSEIYFDDNDDWTIELYDYYGYPPGNLDYCYIESTTNMAFFNNGITFTSNDTLVVTNADMQTDLIINREGDYLIMGGWTYDEICWGNYSNLINAPYPGQSLCRVPIDDYFIFVKENQPSLGHNPFDVQTFGSLDGIVTYSSGIPIYGAEVSFYPVGYSVITDEFGYFLISGIYGMNYDLTVTLNDTIIVEMTVTIEPDETTYVELIPDFDIDPQPQYHNCSLSNHPNPFYDKTEIHYSLPYNSAGSITIFNSKGQKIREIAVSPNENSISWSGLDENNTKVPSGVYFYNLDCENKTLASGKMLYLI